MDSESVHPASARHPHRTRTTPHLRPATASTPCGGRLQSAKVSGAGNTGLARVAALFDEPSLDGHARRYRTPWWGSTAIADRTLLTYAVTWAETQFTLGPGLTGARTPPRQPPVQQSTGPLLQGSRRGIAAWTKIWKCTVSTTGHFSPNWKCTVCALCMVNCSGTETAMWKCTESKSPLLSTILRKCMEMHSIWKCTISIWNCTVFRNVHYVQESTLGLSVA